MRKLEEFLAQSRRERTSRRVTLLPDIFVDEIITIPRRSREFLSEARRILNRGGGNYTDVRAELTLGGCAANSAAALSGLEIPTSLISKTTKTGRYILRITSDSRYLDLSHVSTDGNLAVTASLEIGYKGERANLMVTDTGSIGSFSPDDLNDDDMNLLRQSFMVGIFSWNLNQRGTELLEKVTGFCFENGVQTYVDIGDPIRRIGKLRQLIDRVLGEGRINYLSVNENELRSLSRSLAISRWQDRSSQELAQEVAEQLPVELAVHTPHYAGLVEGNKAIFCPTFEVTLRRTTGAGDAWNAGNIFGLIKEADRETRLMTANLLAAKYISSPQRELPSLRELSGYVKEAQLKAYTYLS